MEKMHPHASRAAAEAAAIDGLQSSPDTQECREIFKDLMGVEFETADLEPTINTPLTTDEHSPSVPRDDCIFKKPELPGHVLRAVLATAHGGFSQSGDPSLSNNGHKHLVAVECRQQPRTEEVVDDNRAQSAKWISRRDDRGRLRYSLSDGTQVHPSPQSSSMEDILSPLYSSDGSNLSKTQENDPAVYERFLAHTTSTNLPYPSYTRSLATQDATLRLESGMTATDTTRSYAPDDTGHLTLDYKPPLPAPMHDSFDEAEEDEISHVPLISKDAYTVEDDPRTPLQPKPDLGRPGTVMRLSQMFAQTQPSPGIGDLQTMLSSSSRPSPDLFRHQQTPKDIASSPLFQRGGKVQDANTMALDIVSSSPKSPFSLNVNQLDGLPHSDFGLIPPSGEHVPFGPNSSIPKSSGPYEMYIPRKESQERRMRQAAINDDSRFSDDDFSDGEMERNRRAKLKKKQAAMALATVGTSRPGSSGNDIVEVPSTSNGRRRSQAEAYVAQCSGFDERDSQQDGAIADSQSVPATNLSYDMKTSSQGRLKRLDKSGFNRSRRSSSTSAEVTTLSDRVDIESSGQLPGLVENEDSDATESDREVFPAPARGSIVQPLREVSSNVADLRTPAPAKKIFAIDGVTMIPETSPSEPHLHKYGEIVSQTPPALSTEDGDDAFNLFTQDAEFNQIMSPSPQRMTQSRITINVKANSKIEPEQDSELLEKPELEETASSLPDSAAIRLGDRRLEDVATSKPNSTAPDDESEYVTAPTIIPTDVDAEVNSPSLKIVGQQRVSTHRPIQRPRWSPITSPLSSVPHQDRSGSDKDPDVASAGVMNNTSEVHNNKGRSDNKSRRSQRLNRDVAGQIEDRSTESSRDDLNGAAREHCDLGSSKSKPTDHSKGSSKALQRVAGRSNGSFHTKPSESVTPVSKIKKTIRSSGRDSEKSKSVEAEEAITPVLPTRRKAATNKSDKNGIFAEMAFSVSYGNRDDEKERIIRLIKQNGGRVLDKGFDELFDMSASEVSICTKSFEDKDEAGKKNLVLAVEAARTTFTCLIADVHSRRAKFMQALALGLPCLSGRWIEHCVAHGYLLDWDVYLLAAGESSYLGGAVRNRNLQPYPVATAKLSECIERRQKLLAGKSILIVMGRGRAEERKKAYLFLTHALGARHVRRTQTNQEARKILLEAESNGEEYNWVYVDDDERDAERIIFGTPALSAARKRKRSTSIDENEDKHLPPKKIKVISDEFVIQSLILGKLIEED